MTLQGKTIFIIGTGGKLGHAFQYFSKDFDKVFYYTRENCDITNQSEVEKNIMEHKPHIVINASAFNAVDKCEEPQGLAEAIAVNADGPKYLAEACSKANSILVHFSSDYVFAGNDPNGYAEDSPIKPVNAYGWTKWLGERAIWESKTKAYIIRTSRLFGPPGTSQHGRSSVIEQVVKLASRGEKIDVVDGEYACPTYSDDLASTTFDILKKEFPFGIYHVTNSDACSRFEFYKAIAEAMNVQVNMVPVKAETVPRPAIRPQYSILKNTKIQPLRNWRDALKDLALRT